MGVGGCDVRGLCVGGRGYTLRAVCLGICDGGCMCMYVFSVYIDGVFSLEFVYLKVTEFSSLSFLQYILF